jgi:hypothetical protein
LINNPYGNLPIKEIRRDLLAAAMRFAGQLTLEGTLRCLLLKQSARENPRRRGRPPEPWIDPKWSSSELQTRIITTALQRADISDGRRRRSLLAALRYYRSEWNRQRARQRGRRPADRLPLVPRIVRYQDEGEKTVSAIAGRLFDDGYYENLRKAAIVVADIIDIIGNPGRNPNKIKIVRNR